MQSNKYFTSFYPVDSSVHRLNPVIKLICLILLLVSMALNSDIRLCTLMLFVTLYLVYATHVPLRFYFDTI